MAGTRSTGTTFGFEKKGEELTDITVGNLNSIGEVGGDSDEIDVTTLDSTGGYREFLQGFKDAGEIALSGYYLEGKNHDKVIEFFDSGESRTGIITFPTGATMNFPCFVKSYKMGPAETDGAIGFSATIRVTGKPTFSEGEGT